MEAIGVLTPTDSPAGRLLALGSRVVTVTSKATRSHVTLRIEVEAVEAGQLVRFLDYDGELKATYYGDHLAWGGRVTDQIRWTVNALLRHATGGYELLPAVAFLDVQEE